MYRGPEAPLTSLCIHNNHIYAGCWDKSIWTWPLLPQTGSGGGRSAIAATKPRQYHGHSDFVKTVACTSHGSLKEDILISGAQDAKIIIWNAQTSAKLKVLTGHARGVLSLAISPLQLDGQVEFFSGGSEGQIRQWRITHSGSLIDSLDAGPLSAHLTRAESEAITAAKAQDAKFDVDVIAVHETSVNALLLANADADDSDQLLSLYTASSDNTAMLLPAQPATVSQGASKIAQAYRKPSATLQHPDFVRAIAPLAGHDADLVATTCRDEGVRIWDTSEAGSLLYCFDGHYEEVTGLAIVGETIVSVSIDGTVRTWPGTRSGIEQAREEETKKLKRDELEESKGTVQLDADEEAELAALMEED